MDSESEESTTSEPRQRPSVVIEYLLVRLHSYCVEHGLPFFNKPIWELTFPED